MTITTLKDASRYADGNGVSHVKVLKYQMTSTFIVGSSEIQFATLDLTDYRHVHLMLKVPTKSNFSATVKGYAVTSPTETTIANGAAAPFCGANQTMACNQSTKMKSDNIYSTGIVSAAAVPNLPPYVLFTITPSGALSAGEEVEVVITLRD